ncbi:MAG: hypothetical protein ACTSV5_11025 [Promethearchaeota archaeon]
MFNHEISTPKLKSIVQKGKIIWSGINGFEIIGDSKAEWNEISIFRFDNATDYQNTVNLLKNDSFKEIKMLAIKPISRIKMIIIHFIMKYIFSRSKIEIVEKARDLEILLNSPILPKKEQFSRLLTEEDGNPVIMLNFLRFFPVAKYSAEFKGKHKKNETGEQAYNRYSQHAMKAVANLGGHLDYVGFVEETLMGEKTDKWDVIGLMRYPTHLAFRKMFNFKDMENGGIYRDAGLERTITIALKQQIYN